MRLTSFTDYGLRVLMRLAGAPGARFTTEALAREFAVSRNHLVKVVGELVQAGLVESRKGAGGGIRLAEGADRVSLGAVIRRLEGDAPLVECFRVDGGGCTLTPGCRLRGRLSEAREVFLRELDKTPLIDCAWPPGGGENAAYFREARL